MNHPAVDSYLDELLAPVAQAAAPGRDAANESGPEDDGSGTTPAAATLPAAAPMPTPAPAPAPALAPVPTPVARPNRSSREEAPSPPPSPAPAKARWLRARLGPDSYAFQLLRVQEVVRVSPVVAMRGARPHVLGVMNLRGRIVPVTDLAMWLGTGRVEPDEHSRIIVLEHEDELMGVLVSTLDDVASIAGEDIEQPFAATGPGAVLGIARSATTPTVLLDATALFG